MSGTGMGMGTTMMPVGIARAVVSYKVNDVENVDVEPVSDVLVVLVLESDVVLVSDVEEVSDVLVVVVLAPYVVVELALPVLVDVSEVEEVSAASWWWWCLGVGDDTSGAGVGVQSEFVNVGSLEPSSLNHHDP